MKLTKEKVAEIVEAVESISGEIESLKPPIKKAIDLIMIFGSELKPLFRAVVLAAVDFKIDAVDRYLTAGFSREEAILLTSEDVHRMKQSLSTINAKRTDGK